MLYTWIGWIIYTWYLNHNSIELLNNTMKYHYKQDFPSSSVGKESACSAGDPGLTPGLGRSPGEGNGSPLQYPCLEDSMNGGAWQAAVHGVTKSWTRLSNFTFAFFHFLLSLSSTFYFCLIEQNFSFPLFVKFRPWWIISTLPNFLTSLTWCSLCDVSMLKLPSHMYLCCDYTQAAWQY